MLPGTGYPFWAPGLVLSAVQECAAVFAGASAGLAALVVLAVPLARRFRGVPGFLLAGSLWAAAAWVLRDRLFLLADSLVNFQMVELAGRILIDERAPVTARLMEGAARVSGASPAALFGAGSVLSGLTVALILWRSGRGEDRRPGPAAFLVLVFGFPLGFVFYGHVETYPLWLAGFALVLAAIGRGLDRGGVGPLELGLLVALCFMHYLSALLFLPLVTVLLAGRAGRGRLLAVFGALLLIVGAAAAAVEPLREYTLFARSWTGPEAADYAWDVLNGWFLLCVPLGGLSLAYRERIPPGRSVRFLGLATATYALLPLIAMFDLGMYRDLDLMSPAFVALCFLVGRGLRGARLGPGFVSAGLVGAILLAAFQVHQICPVGAREMERHLDRRAMEEGARWIGTEVLAYHYRQRGDLEEAGRLLEKAIADRPGNPRLYGPLGEVQLARGDTAAAIVSLRRSMDSWRAPRSAPLLAELLTLKGDARGAIEVLQPHREALMQSSRGAAALAVAYFRAGLPDSTLVAARERVAVDSRDHVAWFNAASALVAMGRPEDALPELERAAGLDPRNVVYHRRLVELLARLRGEAAARGYLEGLDPSLREAVLSGR